MAANTVTTRTSGRLVRRLSLSVAGLVAVGALILGSLGFYFTAQAVTAGFQSKLVAIADVAALRVDGDLLKTIQSESDLQRLVVRDLHDYLSGVLQSQGLTYAYIVSKNADNLPQLILDGSDDPDEFGHRYKYNQSLVDMYTSGKTTLSPFYEEEGFERLMTAYVPVRDKAGNLVGALALDLAAETVDSSTVRSLAFYGAAWLLVVVIGLLVAVRLAREIARRVTPLTAVAQALAAGDVAVTFEAGANVLKRPDEFDDLRTSLQQMQQSLLGLVTNLRESAGQVVAATTGLMTAVGTVSNVAEEANEAMGQVADGTREQAGNASELAAFFTQFSRSLEQFAESADSQARLVAQAAAEAAEIAVVTEHVVAAASGAAGVAVETTEAAVAGAEAVSEAVVAVTQIAGAVTEAAASMEQLNGRAGHIGAISTTIRELADQSNLLALNAAIEAARAGEHGRGFAVVADEVRSLAGRSAESANQINQILTAIQADVNATLTQMRMGQSALQNGSAKAARAQDALDVILDSAARTREQIQQVVSDSTQTAARARAIGEQARHAADQVQQSAAGARTVTAEGGRAQRAVESVAAIAEETAALTDTTQRLMGEVSDSAAQVQQAVGALTRVARELEQATARFRS
jgi:methyl-accepting chemotaxis protein